MSIPGRLLLPFGMAVLTAAALGQNHPSNPQITAQIQDKIYHARVFEHGEAKVTFDEGVATLTGTVDCIGVKNDAERATRKVDDVVRVVNNLQVRAEDITDRQIIERARKEILTYYAYSIYDWITLDSRHNQLTVNGEVSQPFKKEDIANFLAHIKGVAEIENNLEVLPTSQFDDSLRIAIARSIYNDPYFIHYATQALPPIHIIVKNGNVTLEGVVATQLDRAKAESDTSFAGTFFSLTNNLRVEGK